MVLPWREYEAQVKRMILSTKTIIAESLTEDFMEYKLMTIIWSREESKPQEGLSVSWEQ
jgi:hypothetical protein